MALSPLIDASGSIRPMPEGIPISPTLPTAPETPVSVDPTTNWVMLNPEDYLEPELLTAQPQRVPGSPIPTPSTPSTPSEPLVYEEPEVHLEAPRTPTTAVPADPLIEIPLDPTSEDSFELITPLDIESEEAGGGSPRSPALSIASTESWVTTLGDLDDGDEECIVVERGELFTGDCREPDRVLMASEQLLRKPVNKIWMKEVSTVNHFARRCLRGIWYGIRYVLGDGEILREARRVRVESQRLQDLHEKARIYAELTTEAVKIGISNREDSVVAQTAQQMACDEFYLALRACLPRAISHDETATYTVAASQLFERAMKDLLAQETRQLKDSGANRIRKEALERTRTERITEEKKRFMLLCLKHEVITPYLDRLFSVGSGTAPQALFDEAVFQMRIYLPDLDKLEAQQMLLKEIRKKEQEQQECGAPTLEGILERISPEQFRVAGLNNELAEVEMDLEVAQSYLLILEDELTQLNEEMRAVMVAMTFDGVPGEEGERIAESLQDKRKEIMDIDEQIARLNTQKEMLEATEELLAAHQSQILAEQAKQFYQRLAAMVQRDDDVSTVVSVGSVQEDGMPSLPPLPNSPLSQQSHRTIA